MTTPATRGGASPMQVIGIALALLLGVPLMLGISVAILTAVF